MFTEPGRFLVVQIICNITLKQIVVEIHKYFPTFELFWKYLEEKKPFYVYFQFAIIYLYH